MPEQKRRPIGDGVVLLGREQPVPTGTSTTPQPKNAPDLALAKAHHAKLRSRLAAAAHYGHEVCAGALSPCSRDLAWWICRLANRYADDAEAPLARIERELVRAEHLWRACMEVEILESGRWPVGGSNDHAC